MGITHKMVLDSDGKPSAAIIPWDDFERIQERLGDDDEVVLSGEWREELEKRTSEIDSGEAELVDAEEFLKRLRSV